MAQQFQAELDELQTELALRMSLNDIPADLGANGDGQQQTTANGSASLGDLPVRGNTGFHPDGILDNFGRPTVTSELEFPTSLPAFLSDHNVADSLRRADALHMQRGGQPSVFASTFDPVGRRDH
jgi:hypothetical protein